MKKNAVRCGFLAVFLVMGIVGCSQKAGVESDMAFTETEQENPETVESEVAEDDPSHTVGTIHDDYILPEVQTYVYSQDQLSGLSAEELRIARNEIYARHGRIFKSADLDLYFRAKGWYRPTVASDEFDETILNQMELDNLEAVKMAEDQVSTRYIACPPIGRDDFPRINGSTATLPITQAIFRLSTGAGQMEAEAQIQHSKTSWAYEELGIGRTDLVIAYEPGDEVKEQLEKEQNLIIKPIGRDGLVFMANEKNPINTLTQKQIADIYSGKITNWKTLGGKDLDIKAFQRPENSGSQILMDKLAMKGIPMAAAPIEFNISEMGELIDRVSAYDNTGDALGYSVYYYAKNMYQKPGLKFMAVDGVEPSAQTIRDGSYPYVNDFYAAIRKDEPKDSAAYQLFQWLTEEDGQALINELGYVGLQLVKRSLPEAFANQESFSGQIPLSRGNVILGDGVYLFDESGTAVFDSSMKMTKFIRYVTTNSTFFVWDENSPISMNDTLSGLMGLYSMKEDRWLCRPEYSQVVESNDGFYLIRESLPPENAGGEWRYNCDFADVSGKIVKSGIVQGEEIWDADYERFRLNGEEFAETYPEIMAGLGVGVEDISIIGYEYKESQAQIKAGRWIFCYDMYGELLMKFDTALLKYSQDNIYFDFSEKDRFSYVSAYSSETGMEQNFVYQDERLIKELNWNVKKDGYVTMGSGYYLVSRGNYLYVYNFQDEICGKFLYYKED